MDQHQHSISSKALYARLGADRGGLTVFGTKSVLASVSLLALLVGFPCLASPEFIATSLRTAATAAAASEFDLQGPWTMIRDPSAKDGLALQYSGAPAGKDQLPLAVYKQAFSKNAEVSFRLRSEAGRSSQAAGVVVRMSSPQDYYLVQVDALREEILLARIKDGISEEIASVDADVTSHGWHTLSLRAVDNEFTVSFDGSWAFTGFDRTLAQPGSVALWTKGDSVTRFDDIKITPLPIYEER